ncbi:MAG: penicillin-insensitive murein endopeptidase [Hyphomicrobiaceae bacterium]
MGRIARAVMVVGGTAILVALPQQDYARLWSETLAVSQRAAALVNTHIVQPIRIAATKQSEHASPGEDATPVAEANDVRLVRGPRMVDETAREKIGRVEMREPLHAKDDAVVSREPVREVALNETVRGEQIAVVPVSEAARVKTNADVAGRAIHDVSGQADSVRQTVATANVDTHAGAPGAASNLLAPKPSLARRPEALPVNSVSVEAKEDAVAMLHSGLPPLPVFKPEVPEEQKPIPAKMIFGAVKTPAPLAARAIGFYSRGCLSGAKPLPIDGPAWQAMRLSRNRNWGHPNLIALLEKFASEVQKNDGWSGLLVGDISQPRGGPMLTGHSSHQVGLDADIWFTPMPGRRLSRRERERLSATSMLDGPTKVNPKVFTPGHVKVVKRAASYPQIERILVHPAIKKALCEAAGDDRAWLSKVRPYFGHHYHFHIRMKCPDGSSDCRPQKPPAGQDGCGKELDYWFKVLTRPKPKAKPKTEVAKPSKPKPAVTLSDMPQECRAILASGEGAPVQNRAELIKSSIARSRKIIDISGEPRAKIRPQ